MLTKVYKRALKAGGERMPVAAYARVFGNDSALRKNVLRICRSEAYGQAVLAGVVNDHRVVESLNLLGPVAARIVLAVEARLGRKLTRSRAQTLTRTYLYGTAPANVVQLRRAA